jgi:hypothetical protein
MKKSPKKPAESLESLASRIADELLPVPDLEGALCDSAEVSTLYEALEKHVAKVERASSQNSVPMFERLMKALPAEMHSELVKYSDLMTHGQVVARVAGYHVGVMVGRRMAGGAR